MTPSQPTKETTARIRAFNDAFRRHPANGLVVVTSGIKSLGEVAVQEIFYRVRTYTDFNADNDPYGEHDFGALTFGRKNLFWKIDYYDVDLQYGSPDPANPAVTTRLLTIMLAEEW